GRLNGSIRCAVIRRPLDSYAPQVSIGVLASCPDLSPNFDQIVLNAVLLEQTTDRIHTVTLGNGAEVQPGSGNVLLQGRRRLPKLERIEVHNLQKSTYCSGVRKRARIFRSETPRIHERANSGVERVIRIPVNLARALEHDLEMSIHEMPLFKI